MKDLKPHPFCADVSPMDSEEHISLYNSIRTGYLEHMPIVVSGELILDGRHRYNICKELGIEPVIVEYQGKEEDIYRFISATNARRNMTVGKRAATASKMATATVGKPSGYHSNSVDKRPTMAMAAEAWGIGKTSITEYRYVEKYLPALAEAVWTGRISLNAAKEKAAIYSTKEDWERDMENQRIHMDNMTPSEVVRLEKEIFEQNPTWAKEKVHAEAVKRRKELVDCFLEVMEAHSKVATCLPHSNYKDITYMLSKMEVTLPHGAEVSWKSKGVVVPLADQDTCLNNLIDVMLVVVNTYDAYTKKYGKVPFEWHEPVE